MRINDETITPLTKRMWSTPSCSFFHCFKTKNTGHENSAKNIWKQRKCFCCQGTPFCQGSLNHLLQVFWGFGRNLQHLRSSYAKESASVLVEQNLVGSDRPKKGLRDWLLFFPDHGFLNKTIKDTSLNSSISPSPYPTFRFSHSCHRCLEIHKDLFPRDLRPLDASQRGGCQTEKHQTLPSGGWFKSV